MQMNQPLPGRGKAKPTQADLDRDADSFMSALGALKKGA